MRPYRSFLLFGALAAAALAAQADSKPAYLEFSGAIGVDPLTAAGGADVTNTVRGVAPGGRAWVIRKFGASIGADASVSGKGSGLLLASGEGIATRGPVVAVAVTLTCGPADATARKFSSASTPLDTAGNFSVKGMLSEDGVNAAVLPATCDNPQLLVRAVNTSTGALGGWFAAGIVQVGDD